jgi:hypothetical protein
MPALNRRIPAGTSVAMQEFFLEVLAGKTVLL